MGAKPSKKIGHNDSEQRDDLHPLSAIVANARGNSRTTDVASLLPPLQRPRVAVAHISDDTARAESLRSQRTEGVLMIVEFGDEDPDFAIVKDKDKELLGFPFGGRDPSDPTVFDAAGRECREEIFFKLDVLIPELAEDNYAGMIAINEHYAVHVIVISMPADTPMQNGEEQEAAFRVPRDKINEYIARGILLNTHAVAWGLYNEWLQKKSRQT